MEKIKKLVNITRSQVDFLKKISVEKQISFSEVMRRMLDTSIEIERRKERRDGK